MGLVVLFCSIRLRGVPLFVHPFGSCFLAYIQNLIPILILNVYIILVAIGVQRHFYCILNTWTNMSVRTHFPEILTTSHNFILNSNTTWYLIIDLFSTSKSWKDHKPKMLFEGVLICTLNYAQMFCICPTCFVIFTSITFPHHLISF